MVAINKHTFSPRVLPVKKMTVKRIDAGRLLDTEKVLDTGRTLDTSRNIGEKFRANWDHKLLIDV